MTTITSTPCPSFSPLSLYLTFAAIQSNRHSLPSRSRAMPAMIDCAPKLLFNPMGTTLPITLNNLNSQHDPNKSSIKIMSSTTSQRIRNSRVLPVLPTLAS
jgi:hypothetical protein